MGSVDVLVNNAGIQFVSPIETFPQDAWDSIIAVNLTAVMATTKAALPGMRSRKWGRIINGTSLLRVHLRPLTPWCSVVRARLGGIRQQVCVRGFQAWRHWPHARDRH